MIDWLIQSMELSANLGVAEIFLSIILLSYLLEDLAIVSAALLAADHAISPSLALAAIFIGIATGDAGLYGIGRLAANWRALRFRLLKNSRMRMVRTRLKYQPLWNIALIRFIPGLRTIGFTLSGLFRIKFYQFMAAVLLATACWTTLIFICIYQLGSIAWLVDSQWKWILAPCAIAGLWWLNRSSVKKINIHQKGISL